MTRDIITDSILDWIDDNQLHHVNGAEEPYYQSLPKPYSCKDGPIDILEELLLVRGVTREIFYGERIGVTMAVSSERRKSLKGPGLVDLFTVYSSGRRINVNTASRAVLQALPGIGPAGAAAIIKAREKKEFQSIQDVQAILHQESRSVEEFLGLRPSDFFSIYAQGEMETGARRAVRAIVGLTGGEEPSFTILQWDDDAEII